MCDWYVIRQADWRREPETLGRIRELVFVQEQRVPPELEWDDRDVGALHLLAETAAGQAIGTARLLAGGHIGRMAVLPQWRRRGVGSALLRELVRIAREREDCTPFLNAQTRAEDFYRRHGFVAEGAEFLDAGIPHRRMILPPAEQ
jgi:predicted GNAT family N-acyltransferase